jgi:Tfp pilus assembly protein PilV
MLAKTKQDGFSAAEVLIAVGILGVAMILVAGIFPVGLRFAQISIDRTTAAVAANEAFAKVRLYAEQIPDVNGYLSGLLFGTQRDFNDWFDDMDPSNNYLVNVNTFSYPTDNAIDFDNKKYCWSALLRRTDRFQPDPNKPDSSHDVQVTVFVCLKKATSIRYYQPDFLPAFGSNTYGVITGKIDLLPKPVRVEINQVPGRYNELRIQNTNERYLINDGDVIVDDATGMIYRVQERYKGSPPNDQIILLDKDWANSGSRFVWVVPPPAAPGTAVSPNLEFSGRNPCVAVYQKVIRF